MFVSSRVSRTWRTHFDALRWDCGSVSAAWAGVALRWKRWCSRSRESATPNTISAWLCRITWTPWGTWSSSNSCFLQGEKGTLIHYNFFEHEKHFIILKGVGIILLILMALKQERFRLEQQIASVYYENIWFQQFEAAIGQNVEALRVWILLRFDPSPDFNLKLINFVS